MLITLRKNEYLPVLDQMGEDPDFTTFVEILGQALWHEDHAIRAAPLLLERFSQWRGLSGSQSSALRQMARDVANAALPFDEVTDSLVLTGPAGPTPDPAGGVRWHRRDWRWLSDKGRLSRTKLGGENLNDARWYVLLGRAWGARLRLHSANAGSEVRLHPRGLGGDTAKQELPNEGASGDPVLCVLDSDRDYPGAPLGGTAGAATKAIGKLPVGHLVHIEPLQARDVENVLPLQLVRGAAGPGAAWLAPMELRGFFARPHTDPLLCYLDVGKVQCERRLLDSPERSPTRAYREAALTRIRQLDASTGSITSCERLTRGQNACGGKTLAGKQDWDIPSSCVVVHSVGKQLLPEVVRLAEEEYRTHDTARWLEAMLPEQDSVVLDPARLAWSWGLGPLPRIRHAAL